MKQAQTNSSAVKRPVSENTRRIIAAPAQQLPLKKRKLNQSESHRIKVN
jgi:hypothetical protein